MAPATTIKKARTKPTRCPSRDQLREALSSRGMRICSALASATLLMAVASFPLFVVHEPIREPERDQRQRKDDDEEDPGHCRGVAHPELLEGDSIELDRVHQDGVEGPSGVSSAAKYDERLGEHLQGRDDADDQVEEDHRREQWDGDVANEAEWSGAIESGGFVELPRHILQSRQKDDDDRSDAPQTEQDERGHGPGRAGEPRDGG